MIYVLLILAGISIAMLSGNNGILQRATDAKTETEKAQIIENAQTDILGQQTENESASITKEQLVAILNKYFQTTEITSIPDIISPTNDLELTTIDNKYIIRLSEIFSGNFLTKDDGKMIKDLEIGDYVRYGDKLTINTYETNTEETGHSKSQIFETDNQMLWRVMNKKDNGNVELISVSNILSKPDITNNNKRECLYLINNAGFLNAEKVLNDICEELYSNQSYGKGRSLNVEDINNLASINLEERLWSELYNDYISYGNERTYSSGNVWIENTNTIIEATNENPITVINSNYSYELPTNMPLYELLQASNDEIEYYNNNRARPVCTNFFWLASKCWNGSNSGNSRAYDYNMLIRFIGACSGAYGTSVCNYYDKSTNLGGYVFNKPAGCSVRPVVELNSSVRIQNDDAKDGKTELNAYILE